MATYTEGELIFEFPDDWAVEQFDARGRIIPDNISPVDFVIERPGDLLLIEVKDPATSRAPAKQRAAFIREMQTNTLTHKKLVPKARTSWSLLHLMGRTSAKPLRFIVALGIDGLAVEPALLQGLGERLKSRLAQETETPWVRPYVSTSAVIPALSLGRYLNGVTVRRQVPSPS